MAKCQVSNCNNNFSSSSKSFFGFPKEESRKKQWLEILNLKTISKHSTICEDHFKCSQFTNRQKTRLKKDAVPYRNELEFTSELPTPQIGGNMQETLQHGPSTSVTKQCTIIRPRSIINCLPTPWHSNLISIPVPVLQSKMTNNTALIFLPNTRASTAIGEETQGSGLRSDSSVKSVSPLIIEDPETSQSDSSILNPTEKTTVRSQQDCLFCLFPIEQNINDTQEQSKDVYRDIFECSKELLKDKINYSEWIYSEKCLSPLCDRCFKSSQKVYEVNQKLMEFKQTLDELVEKLASEINDRVSKFIKDEDLLEEIKMEDDEVLQEDDDFIYDDNDKESSIFHLENETEVIDCFNSDPDSCDGKEDPLNPEAHCINEKSNEKSVELPEVDYNSYENPMESEVLRISNPESRKDAEVQFPRVILHRLKMDDYSHSLNQSQNCRGSALGKRKAALKAANILRKNTEVGKSVELPENYILPTNGRNITTGISKSSKLTIILEKVRNIALPVVSSELVNLKCNICQKKFSNLQNLVHHKQTVCSRVSIDSCRPKTSKSSVKRNLKTPKRKSGPKSDMVCDICGKPEKSWVSMKSHKLSHNGEHERPFKCSSCGKGFNWKKRLREHFATHHSEEASNVCKVCGKIYKTKVKLSCHMKIHSSERFSCSLCKASFKCRSSRDLHTKIHEGKTYSCSFCSKIFSSENRLKLHKRIYHSGRKPQKYICVHKGCSKIFNSRPARQRHFARRHTEQQEIIFECHICKKKLKSREGLQRHIKNHGEKQFQCTTCGMLFSAANILKSHSAIHEIGDFECRICGKKTNTLKKLKCHMNRIHRLEKIHSCDICGHKSKSKGQIEIHMETVHKKIFKHKCDTCGRSFGQKASLTRHEETHKTPSERKMFPCEICGDKYFASSSARLFHQGMFHTAYTEEMSNCGNCGNKFPNGSELYKHNQARHWDPSKSSNTINPCKCRHCTEIFLTRCDMLLHYANAHSTENLPYKCKICHVVFSSPAILKDHLISDCGKSVSNTEYSIQDVLDENMKFQNRSSANGTLNPLGKPEENKYQCGICGKKFKLCQSYKYHMRTHTGEKPYTCETCGKSFTGKDAIRRHKEYTHLEKRHQCYTCGKKFALRSYLKLHETSHSENKLACVTCGKTFGRTYSLRRHEKNYHLGQRPFVCATCGKTFIQPSHLKLHEQKAHSGERPFVCAICGKTFVVAINLKLHEKIHAGGEKPFSCSFCGKTFSQKANVERHERTHTGERPYQCNYCGKAFVQSGQLKTHERIHTGEKPYSCSVCEKKFSDYSTWHKHKKIHNK